MTIRLIEPVPFHATPCAAAGSAIGLPGPGRADAGLRKTRPNRPSLPGRLLAAWLLLSPLWAAATPTAGLDHLVKLLSPHPLETQMQLVNRAINGLDHAPGPEVWLTPGELLQRGAGDCKDLAYAKYWILKQVAEGYRDMRLGYGHVHLDGRWHLHLVLLVWTDEGSPWVLDNLTDSVRRLSARPDLALQLSFDEERHFAGTTDQAAGPTRIRGWAALQARMAAAASATPPQTMPVRAAPSGLRHRLAAS